MREVHCLYGVTLPCCGSYEEWGHASDCPDHAPEPEVDEDAAFTGVAKPEPDFEAMVEARDIHRAGGRTEAVEWGGMDGPNSW